DACARLDALWDDLTLEAPPFWIAAAQRDLAYFGLPGFYTPRSDFWTAPSWTYLYDTRPLLATLGRHVDFAALNASRTAFAARKVAAQPGRRRGSHARAQLRQPPAPGSRHRTADQCAGGDYRRSCRPGSAGCAR